MDRINTELLHSMKKLEYYDVLRYALGMKYFLTDERYEVVTGAGRNEENISSSFLKSEGGTQRERILASLYLEGKKSKTFLIRKEDYDQKTFHDDKGVIYDAHTFFDDIDDDILWFIIMGVNGNKDYSSFRDWYRSVNGRRLFEEHKPSELRFILGAGINSGYGIGGWDQLIDSIRDEICRIKRLPPPDPKEILRRLEEDLSNTNYIAPQILKDLDPPGYYDTIYNDLYGHFNIDDTDISLNPWIEDTTLYQVARILSSQPGKGQALTFNYDNVLELVLEHSLHKITDSVYSSSKKDPKADVEIIHSHGFFPFVESGRSTPHAIVFSSYEYMNGYLSSNSYARSRLNEQIKRSNILIGNRLSDYEEQKVFFLHHKKYPKRFSFLFTTISDSENSWMEEYKTIYFLQLGVIPVFFNNYPEMIRYLKTL